MTATPIEDLVADLRKTFARDAQVPGVKTRVAKYIARNDDWRRFMRFEPDRYTRHLVGLSEQFELVVLCWNPDQATPIHGHEGQHCWMAVLEGAIEEVHYAVPEPRAAAPLKRTRTLRYEPGNVGYIHDAIGLHLIRPAQNGPCVSLHLYSLPFRECNVYCPDTGTVTRKALGYDSVHCEVNDGPAAERWSGSP